MYGGIIPDGDTVTTGGILLLSSATGIVQFTDDEELAPRFSRISEGQLRNIGGVTSARITNQQT